MSADEEWLSNAIAPSANVIRVGSVLPFQSRRSQPPAMSIATVSCAAGEGRGASAA
jgi:hypothetical protein